MGTNVIFFRCLWAAYFLCGMHFFMHNPGGAALYLPFNAAGWIFASLLIGAGLWQITLKHSIIVSRFFLWLSLGASLLFIPIAYPGFDLTDHAIPRLLGLAGGLVFLFCLYQWRFDHAQRVRLLYWILGAVVIEAFLGMIQLYVLAPGNWIGYNAQTSRPYGIFQQPNIMASFLATGLAIAAWLNAVDSGADRRLSALRYVVIFTASLMLAVLQSRVGLLGGLLALALISPLVNRVSPVRLRLIWACVCWGALIGLTSMSFMTATGISRGIEFVQAGSRYVFWPYVVKLIAENPWLGHGYGSFEAIFLDRYAADKALNPAMADVAAGLDHPHNEFLFWAMEGGVVPMAGMLLIAAFFLWRISKVAWLPRLALLGLAVPILLHTQTEYPFYQAISHWWIFLFLMYLMDVEVEQRTPSAGAITHIREYPLKQRLFAGVLAVCIPLLVVPFMVTALHTASVVVRYERGGFRDPAILLGIVNPVPWLNRVEFNIHNIRFIAGMKTRDSAHLEDYVAWGKSFVHHTPRAAVYVNMVLALKALGRDDEANAMQLHARRLYPKLAWHSIATSSAAATLDSFSEAQ